MRNVLETLARTIIGFFILLLFTHVPGKKQRGQLSIFTYITGITFEQ